MKTIRGKRSRTALSVIGAAAILLTSACAAPTSNGSGGGSGAVPENSILVAADNGSPTFEKNFNPFSPNKRKSTTYMYEPLEVINTLDGAETPFLATGYTVRDAKTLDYTIRSGVTWSDGKAFTAEDVEYTFELVKSNAALDMEGVWQHIESVEVNGDIVTFHLLTEDIPAAFVISQQLIVPKHIWKDVKDPLTWANEDPIATGPYVVDAFSPNQYSLKKNTSYWQADKVAVEGLVFPASNTQLDVVKNGYDWAYAFMSDIENTWVAADKQHNTYWFPPGGTIALLPNLTKAPYSDINFREGISLALDRDKIAEDAEQGYVEAAGQSGLLLPNQESWLNPDLKNKGVIKQDSAAALEAFKKAGYTQKDGKLVDASGNPLSISITTANGYTDWLQGLQTVQSQLGTIGITVTINQPQPAAYEQARNTGDFDMIMTGFGGTGSVYTDYNSLLSSEFLQPIGTTTTANFQRFDDAETNTLLAQLKVTADETEQKTIVNDLQTQVYTKLPMISMFYGGSWGLFSDKKYTGWPSAEDPYAPPNTWDSTPLLVLTHLKKA